MPKKTSQGNDGTKMDDKIFYIIAYIIPLLTGLLVLFINQQKDKRLNMHAFQAIFLGILFIIVWVILGILFFIPFIGLLDGLITLLLWLYGLYVGFEAYNGRDVAIPTITYYAKRYSGYRQK